MAPFAQLGMMGVRFLNIVLGLTTALLTCLTAKKLNYQNPILAILLVFTSFRIQKTPVELAPTQQQVKIAAEWL